MRICDTIVIRADEGKNFGSVLIPEGLLSHISAYKNLITEMNNLFAECENAKQKKELAEELLKESSVKEKLTPWSFSLYNTLPDFMRLQMVTAQQIDGDVNMSHLETEKLIAHFIAEELKRRKQKGIYKGTFSPVTHFFGYQGRAAHPSLFDCSLGSVCGFGAACLIENNLTGMGVAVKDVTRDPLNWRVGGVPLLSMLRSQPKAGYKRNELVIPSQEVSLQDIPYQRFKANERNWRMNERYQNPGPIQYKD